MDLLMFEPVKNTFIFESGKSEFILWFIGLFWTQNPPRKSFKDKIDQKLISWNWVTF